MNGVYTACNQKYFSYFKNLVDSIKDQQIAVYDLGLSEEQLNWCKSKDIIIIKNEERYYSNFGANLIFSIIKETPFETTLWLDSDCLCVKNIKVIFDYIENKPFVIQSFLARNKTAIKKEEILYKQLSVEKCLIDINLGVFGFDKERDEKILDDWIEISNNYNFQIDPSVYLKMAIEKNKQYDMILSYGTGWNIFANSRIENEELKIKNHDTILHFNKGVNI